MPPPEVVDLIANGGLSGIVMLTILAILRGWLAPDRSVQQLLDLYRARLDEAVARGDEWKQAAAAAETARLNMEHLMLTLARAVDPAAIESEERGP